MLNVRFKYFLTFIFISSSTIILLHFHQKFQQHENQPRHLVDIPEYPAIFSAPIPSVQSPSYEAMADFDIVDTSDDRLYFMIHNRFEHIELSLKIENFELEQDMTSALHEPPESYHSNYFAGKNSNVSPSYSRVQNFDCYRSVEGSYQTMEFLSTEYPTLTEIIQIGPSYLKSRKLLRGGHELQVLKVTNQESTVSKSPLFVICGIHPRELAPPEVCARFAERILAEYGVDSDITWILDYTEIHILMQANPDGRENEEANLCRYRRKNMHADIDGCRGTRFGGVDLNRNFPHPKWATRGVPQAENFVKCRDNYQGESEGSEKETQAIVNYIESVIPPGSNIIDDETGGFTADSKGVLMDMHAHGEAFFWPYAYDKNITSPNEEGFKAMADKMASHTIDPTYSTNNDIYEVSGDTTDYAYSYLGLAAFTAEIGSAFHEKCSYFEESVIENMLSSLLYAARVSYAPFLLPKGPEVASLSLSKEVISSDDFLILSATVSGTGEPIDSIKVYIDSHPYLVDSIPIAEVKENFSGLTASVFLNFTLAEGASQNHTFYVQAYDIKGPGPVYSKNFRVDENL